MTMVRKRNKTARYRAALKAKHTKARRRAVGLVLKRKPGGRMKRHFKPNLKKRM